MKKQAEKGKSENSRAEYIKVERNVHLHITDAGKGRPIVLIPGWPFSDEMYEYQYTKLMNNFRVIGITLRGFGASDKPYGAYDYDVHANDINKILKKLSIKDAILGGFSMGGAIAIRYMATYGTTHVSKLALFGAAAPVWTQRKNYPYNFSKSSVNELIELNYHNRPNLLSNFSKQLSETETSLSEGIGDWLYNIGISASSYATAQCLIALRDTDLRKDLKKIKVPTLIMHGKKDKICSFDLAEQLHSGVKHSTLVAFETSGHSLFLDEKHKFNEELTKFAKE